MALIKAITCGDCGVKEGELHILGCDQETCPFCGGQLLCCLQSLGCKRGLREDWERSQKRIPFILYPNLCAKCGTLWPEIFLVPDAEWDRYIEPQMREAMLCKRCYAQIKALIQYAEAMAEKRKPLVP
jgi:hypothetical protein